VTPLRAAYQAKSAALLATLDALGMSIGAILEHYSGQILADSKLDKAAAFLEIVSCEVSDPTLTYLDTKCGSLGHHRDNRTGPEYAADLVYGWIVEDAVLARLSAADPEAVLSGHDRFREFLPAGKISSQPDIRLRDGGESRLLEVFADWTGHWQRVGQIDLRDAKYDRLMREEALMLGLAPLSAEGFLLDFRDDPIEFAPVSNPRYGGKESMRSNQIRERLRPIDEVLETLESRIAGPRATTA
jgi:hypothetical protein